MLSLKQNKISMVESKMSELHASIGDHLDKHIAAYKAGKMDAERLGDISVATHAKIAKEHNMSQLDAKKFVNDYVDSKLSEETEIKSFSSFISEAIISASGAQAERLKKKYLDPYVGSEEYTHDVATDHVQLKKVQKYVFINYPLSMAKTMHMSKMNKAIKKKCLYLNYINLVQFQKIKGIFTKHNLWNI